MRFDEPNLMVLTSLANRQSLQGLADGLLYSGAFVRISTDIA